MKLKQIPRQGVSVMMKDIPKGTVFSGRIRDVCGVWLAVLVNNHVTPICLVPDKEGHSISSSTFAFHPWETTVDSYMAHDATLSLEG